MQGGPKKLSAFPMRLNFIK